jgi:hypothetical protein
LFFFDVLVRVHVHARLSNRSITICLVLTLRNLQTSFSLMLIVGMRRIISYGSPPTQERRQYQHLFRYQSLVARHEQLFTRSVTDITNLLC